MRSSLSRPLSALAALLVCAAQLPAFASEMPPLLDAALAEAEARGDFRASFTMRFVWKTSEPILLRYDAAAEAWSTLSGDPEALPREAREKLEQVMDDESEPGGLLYGDFREHLKDVRRTGEAAGAITYAFRPARISAAKMAEADAPVVTALVVEEATGTLQRYTVRALKPFKPMPVAKLEAFETTQEFARLDEDGPALLTRIRSVQKGSRMFSKIDVDYTATFTDVVPLRR